MSTNPISEQLTSLEGLLEGYFVKQAPAMPVGLKDFLVAFAPYLSILGVAIAVPGLFTLFGLIGFGSALMPAAVLGSVFLPQIILSIALAIPSLILQIMAIPGLFAKTQTGWRFMFWAQLFSIVSQVIQFNIIGIILGVVLGFYILFQVKDRYK